VNKPDRIFRINIGFLINQPIGYTREIPFQVGHFTFRENIEVEDLEGMLILNRTQSGLRINAEFNAKMEAQCGRCLENFMLPLSTKFEEIFTFENHPLSEDELIIPEDGNIDFQPYICDYLMLEVPINPICKPDCQGLCDICGENLNIRDCGHEHERSGMTAMAQSFRAVEGNKYPGKNAPIGK
jgi:uncharacterized protein